MRYVWPLLLALLLCCILWVVLYWLPCSGDSSERCLAGEATEQTLPAAQPVEPSPPLPQLPQMTIPQPQTSPRPPAVGVDDEEGVLSGEDWRNDTVIIEVPSPVDGGSGGDLQEDTPRRRRR